MKSKKITLIIASILMAIIIIMSVPVKSKATNTVSLVFGIKEFREDAPDNMAYSIGDPNANTSTSASDKYATYIWQIVEYADKAAETYSTDKNYYCVKSGVGFDNTNTTDEYTISYDFKTERSLLQNSGSTVLQSIVEENYYYKILALSDLLYLKGISTEEERTALLEAAGIYAEDYTTQITDSDIEAVQQAAIWYFTNHADEDANSDNSILFNNIYNKLGKKSWLNYKTEGMSGYTSLSAYKLDFDENDNQVGEGLFRQEQAEFLYDYLINTAIANETNYKNGTDNSRTKITLYTNATAKDTTQPIILIEREPEIIIEKEFDLALRKNITKVDGVALTGENSRVPVVATNTLASARTATYKHRKDPVVVKTNSVVTYNLTIYNEGEQAGRATKIIDQLPTGVRFSKINTNGFTANYDQTTNRVTIIRDNTNTANLNAYDGGTTLNLETIEIECIVTALPDSKNQKILTNVAWIAEEYNAEKDITIIAQEDADRDSEPATVPSVNKDNMVSYAGNSNKADLTDSNYYYKGQQDDDDFEKLVLEPAAFDLKLIKRIVEVNGTKVPERLLGVDITELANGTKTTANYQMDKEPVSVKKGDIVKYTLRVYNEGDIDGYASEISEDVPEGLEFIWSEETEAELQANTTLSEEEKEAIRYNQGMWDIETIDLETQRIEMIKTDYLAKGKGAEITTDGANLIKAFDSSINYINTVNSKNPDYREVSVYMKVISDDVTGTVIRNEAAITGDTDSEGNSVEDRDSKPENWVKYEDDEDYDNIKLQSFDLALRKFIIAVSDDTTIEDEDYLKNSDGTYKRAPIVDTSKLNSIDENGKMITTATYNHTKQPVIVEKKDIVVYMLRVYNEGDIDGYASEIKDHLPSYLEYVDTEFNKKYGWTVSNDGRTVTTSYLDNAKINAAEWIPQANGITTWDDLYKLYYKEVPVMCRVKDSAKTSEKITNIADITVYKDEKKNLIVDRDSEANNVVLPSDEKLSEYKDNEIGTYIPGQQDDDDFEKLIIKSFDLALRKFITGVNDEQITTRVPEVKYDKENNKITYEHTKDPVEVATNDIVVYTIRVYNEGETDGYASEISDDLPEGLEYLPENELNKEYRWVMYDEEGNETDDVSKAVRIKTDYLSKEQGESRIGQSEVDPEGNPALLKAFNKSADISEENPWWAGVQVAFKVTEPNTSDKIIINSAQISEDTNKDGKPVEDIDSTPDEWIDGEDDQDKEYLKVTYFDLALRKWVTQAIVIEDGKETITQTGHTPEQDPEPVVKVELNRKKLNSLVVKFRYSIRITNEGDIAGYAKEITDYVPEGLKFVAQDNPDWKDEGNNVISTRLLENTLLQPGESADVEVLLTWINSKDNMGLKVNVAEISEDYNDKDIPDIDSTPDNKVEGEDDIDDAPVILSITTGQARVYFVLGFAVLITLASGIILIKKFVL